MPQKKARKSAAAADAGSAAEKFFRRGESERFCRAAAKEAREEAAEDEVAAAEGKMTERQARALLDSLKSDDEHVRLVDPNERKRTNRPVHDW